MKFYYKVVTNSLNILVNLYNYSIFVKLKFPILYDVFSRSCRWRIHKLNKFLYGQDNNEVYINIDVHSLKLNDVVNLHSYSVKYLILT